MGKGGVEMTAARNDFNINTNVFLRGCNLKSHHNILKSKLHHKPDWRMEVGLFPVAAGVDTTSIVFLFFLIFLRV